MMIIKTICLKKLFTATFSIFLGFVVGNDTYVTMVARWVDYAVFHCFFHSATRFVGVRAVVEAAVFQLCEYLGEIVRNVLLGHSHHTKTFDSGGVDNVSAKIEVKHLGECGGVLALKAVHRYVAGF